MAPSAKRSLLFSIVLSLACIGHAQNDLVFNKKFAESEDKWVAFEKGKGEDHVFGFIYIDQMAGLTLEYVGNFIIDGNGKFIPKTIRDTLNAAYKIRLKPNNVQVAIIPEARFAELNIQPVPDWLHIYKTYKDTAYRLQRWGYYYNDFGMSEKALEYLEPGYKKYPEQKDMAVELAFAYNALGKFDKAIPVLNKTIELTPENGYVYKELSYAYMKMGNIEDAEKAALKGIKYYKDNLMKAEMAYNITYQHYMKKDLANFNKWATETRKWIKKDDQYDRSLQLMGKKIKE